MVSKAAPVVASALAALALTAALLRQGPAVALSQLATTDAAPQEQSTTTNFLSDDALALAGEIASERGMEDLVTVLPGANFVNSFATFSGYLDVSDTKKTFYWFVTARDASKAKDKPVVMWTNGGPGCSGLIGFWTEMGPWRATEDMTIEPFDFAWNKEANMLFIESPTGVGFSTSNKDADFDAGDWSTAKDNFELLKQFFGRFPGLADNDLYLSGESYGGHYVPRAPARARTSASVGRAGQPGARRASPDRRPSTAATDSSHGFRASAAPQRASEFSFGQRLKWQNFQTSVRSATTATA